ncbi:hypothetical protein ACWDZ8_43730 [Streptomyces sp. NPDC003233]
MSPSPPSRRRRSPSPRSLRSPPSCTARQATAPRWYACPRSPGRSSSRSPIRRPATSWWDALDDRLHSVSQLVYIDGLFAGRFLLGGSDARARALGVQADGPWTTETAPLAAAPVLTAGEHRPASDVLHHTGGPATALLRYEGDAGSDDGGRFLVNTSSPDGTRFLDELANQVGGRSASVRCACRPLDVPRPTRHSSPCAVMRTSE